MNDFYQIISKGRGENKRKIFDTQPLYVQYGLITYSQFENSRTQTPLVQLFISESIKELGNKHFKKGDCKLSLIKYYEALSIFKYIVPNDRNWEINGKQIL